MEDPGDVEALVRSRLRGLRLDLGWSLDELASRSHLSASTISRIETGNRTMSIEVLATLATALSVDVGALLQAGPDADDVVIRPTPMRRRGATTWRLSHPASRTTVVKMRLEPTATPRASKVHPGHDWLYVLSGRLRLTLAGREIIVEAGEGAEFSTNTSHAFDALDGPAELMLVYDADGRRAHLHTDVVD